MKKFNLKLPREGWGHLKSKYPVDSEFLRDDDFSDGTKNIDTTVKGVITKRKGSVPYNPTLLASPAKDQYESIFEDGVRHLLIVQSGEVKYSAGDGVFNTVVNGTGFVPLSNFEFVTMNNKVYFDNEVNQPQVYDRTTGYGGVAYSAPQMKEMGSQVPGSAPLFVSQAAASGPETGVPTGSYRYKCTFVYYDIEESNPSVESTLITVPGANEDINLTIPVGGYGVTKRNIYRTVDGLEDYLLIGTLSNNTATAFEDNSDAGTIAITTNHDLPPVFGGITEYQEAAWIYKILGEPFTLRYSNKGLPGIMPGKNFLICNQQDPIVNATKFKGRLIILNRNSMGQIQGNNFFNYIYNDIQGSVGCVDERTVQVRTIQGIPTLIWLSDKGFYSYNGNSIDYISDPIEDLVNFNIQQAQFNKGKQEFSSDIDFNALTKTDGILVSGGDLSTITPRKSYSTQFEWDNGDIVDLSTSQGIDTIKSLTDKQFGRIESGSSQSNLVGGTPAGTLEVPTKIVISGEDHLADGGFDYFHGSNDDFYGQPLVRSDAGTYNSITVKVLATGLGGDFSLSFHKDLAGQPQPTPFATTGNVSTGPGTTDIALAVGYSAIAGEKVWIVVGSSVGGNAWSIDGGPYLSITNLFTTGAGGTDLPIKARNSLETTWRDPLPNPIGITGIPQGMAAVYDFTQAITTSSGQWVSAEYDTESIYEVNEILYNHTVENETTVSGSPTVTTVTIQGSNTEILPRIWTNVKTFNTPALGDNPFTPSTSYRYWRIVIAMFTPDNRKTGPTEGTPRLSSDPNLKFPDAGTWESQGFFTSSDVTSFDSLTHNSSLPAQVVLEIATSATQVGGYSAFTLIGSATPNTWAKVRATITTTPGNVAASVGSIVFDWSIESTAEVDDASPIDTTLNNVGWNIFVADVEDNGGTTLFEMKSAASIPAIPGASFFTVIPLSFPSGVPVNQFAKWKVTISSSALSVPVISTVVPQWYLGTSDSIRATSLFFNRSYYVSAAKFGSTTNNILIVLDGENRWRLYEDLNVNTMGLFFNDPFFGSSDTGKIFKFLEGDLDKNSDNIAMDLRTRAFDFGKLDPAASDKVKLIKQVEVRFKNTGAKYQVWYSVDEGQNFFLMFTDDGADFYTTSETGSITPVRFRVNYDLGQSFSGRTIMIRITNDDGKPAQIHNIRFKGFIREADVINVAQ